MSPIVYCKYLVVMPSKEGTGPHVSVSIVGGILKEINLFVS